MVRDPMELSHLKPTEMKHSAFSTLSSGGCELIQTLSSCSRPIPTHRLPFSLVLVSPSLWTGKSLMDRIPSCSPPASAPRVYRSPFPSFSHFTSTETPTSCLSSSSFVSSTSRESNCCVIRSATAFRIALESTSLPIATVSSICIFRFRYFRLRAARTGPGVPAPPFAAGPSLA